MAHRLLLRMAAMVLALAAQSLGSVAAAAPGGSDGDVVDAENAQACIEQDRKVSRILNSGFGARFMGPTPDLKDIAYGSRTRETLDVFRPTDRGAAAPVIFMVHGGGWCVGDKRLKAVTANKVEHYVPKGFVLVSVNYPMVPDGAAVPAQADAVARALAYVQQHASDWGGDGRRIVLMGHSAGAHLVSLVNADARLRRRAGVAPVLGVVSLDSGATNALTQIRGLTAPKIRERFVEAFGRNESNWIEASPFHQLDRSAAAWLGVCSSRRKDNPCAQAEELADKARGLGLRAQVLPQDKNHGAINADLGLPGAYTEAVDAFIGSLDPSLRSLLGR